MFSSGSFNDERLGRLIRSLSKDEALFKQGDLGNTLFIILQGSIELCEDRDGQLVVVDSLSAGEVIGEKALLSETPYRRSYGAVAKEETALLELDAKSLKTVENLIPDFATRLLQITVTRLDRANRLIQLLKSLDPLERLIESLLYIAKEKGKKTRDGVEVADVVQQLYLITYLEKDFIKICLEQMAKAKRLKFNQKIAVISDEAALQQYLPELRERMAA